MSPDKEKLLADKYPVLFGRASLPETKSLMCYGCEFADGWFDLVDRMCAELTERFPEAQFDQVKEKFGCLRVYMYADHDGINEVLDRYEAQSATVCEDCGKPGRQTGGGWIRTRCQECAAEREINRKEWQK